MAQADIVALLVVSLLGALVKGLDIILTFIYYSSLFKYVNGLFPLTRRHQMPLLRSEELVRTSLRLEHRGLYQLPKVLHEI